MSINGDNRLRRTIHVVLAAGLACAACAQAGCASISYVDPEGSRHVMGLVALKLQPAAAGGGTVVGLTTFGASFRAGGEDGTYATLGYSHDLILSLPPNACVDLNEPGPCRDLSANAPRRRMPEKEK